MQKGESGRESNSLPRIKRPFQQAAATSSGPHSQHLWRCRKHDAIPSPCLSLHRQQLQDPAETPCSTTDGLTDARDLSTPSLGLVVAAAHDPPHLQALPATLRPAMVNAPPSLGPSTGRSLSALVSRTMATLGARR